ncbi:hypothetical protein BDF20DRAFT_822643, partial [Mycotypha africana]|uniref:uncharacterized protein n=1 Tax=Mycotypha africana TaxID=64632 RepID=UPI002300C58D
MKYYSLQLPLNEGLSNAFSSTSLNNEDDWDPHIDTFEILKAKLSNITRSMQEFQVEALISNKHSNVPKSFDNGNNINSSSSNDGRHENNHHKQHRRRSQSQNPDALRTLSISHDDNDDKDSIFLHHRLSNLYRTHSNVSSTIFSTTHSLIHSRLDELSETASIRSNPSSSGTEELLAWQNQFVNLISNCINHSEALESLSTDLLRTEDRVRGLLLLQEAVQDQLAEYEKHYEQRIRLLQKVTQEQLALIDALGTLTAEIDQLKGQQRSSAIHSDDLRNENEETDEIQDEDEDEDEDDDTRSASYDSRLCGTRQLLWNTNQNAFNVLELQNKHEELQQLRWEVGMLLDGMIGTG